MVEESTEVKYRTFLFRCCYEKTLSFSVAFFDSLSVQIFRLLVPNALSAHFSFN